MGKIKSERLIATYGDKILDAGFTSVPNLLLEHQEDLGLDDKELLLFIKSIYLSYKKEQIKDIELKMISSPATLNRIRRNLKDKKFLQTKIFYEQSNDGKIKGSGIKYNWKGLIDKLREIADDKLNENNQNEQLSELPNNQNDGTVMMPGNHIDCSAKNELNSVNLKSNDKSNDTVTISLNGIDAKYRLVQPNNQNDCLVENHFSPSPQNSSLLFQNDCNINRSIKDNISVVEKNNNKKLEYNISKNQKSENDQLIFCPRCLKKNKRYELDEKENNLLYCPVCKKHFDVELKEIKIQKPKKQTDPRISELIKFTKENHPEQPYIVDGKMLGGGFKNLLKVYDDAGFNGTACETIKQRMDNFFKSDYPKTCNYPISLFLKQHNSYQKVQKQKSTGFVSNFDRLKNGELGRRNK